MRVPTRARTNFRENGRGIQDRRDRITSEVFSSSRNPRWSGKQLSDGTSGVFHGATVEYRLWDVWNLKENTSFKTDYIRAFGL